MTTATTVPFTPALAGYAYRDLFLPARLADLDRAFRDGLAKGAPDLAERFERYRGGARLGAVEESALLVEASRALSAFVARLFGVEREREELKRRIEAEASLFRFRWSVVQKRVAKAYPDAASLRALDAASADGAGRAVVALLAGAEANEEAAVARAGVELLELAASLAVPRGKDASLSVEAAAARVAELSGAASRAGLPAGGDSATRVAEWTAAFDAYVARLRLAPEHHGRTRHWPSLRVPAPFRLDALVPTFRTDPALPEERTGDPAHGRARDGFDLTDPRKTAREVTGETHYCLLCHEREKDSCAKGFVQKDGSVRKNPLGVPLSGCPLEERISEMHLLRREGDSLGALALVCVDNPMLPGTGHRICNDCMKACIFQAQDPVDIPQVETGVLTDVLSMPWGFEIWSLLTRWNPLNRKRPYPLPYNGRNVLVVGLGPAGYTLAHHLLNEGFGVAAVDGLKIEPLPEEVTGTDDVPPVPVKDARSLFRRLSERVQSGFGGVAEYGITVRWEKSFLDMLHVNIARRRTLRIYPGTRFGGTVTVEQAAALGFDHVAIAAGAGKPTLVDLKNNLLKGIRQASDFLMGLQLTGAFRKDTLANLHVDLPVLVIGGGLTAIDTATEAQAYYPVQVEKTLERWEALAAEGRDAEALASLRPDERETLERHLAHARALRAEREAARREGRTPDFRPLLAQWGGSRIVYRRKMEESPAYRLNHEEIAKALEEGVSFVEELDPVEAVPDAHGVLAAVVFRRKDGSSLTLPCRTLLVAAGTAPNTIYAREHAGSVPLDPKGKFFLPHVAVWGDPAAGPPPSPSAHGGSREGAPEGAREGGWMLVPKEDGVGAFFTGARAGDVLVSYFGDNHPVYAGSVVKAMASARDGAPRLRALFARELDALEAEGFPRQEERDASWRAFAARLDDLWIARVVRVERLTPTIVEVVVKAPAAARNFRPGQFFRFQNFEAFAPRARDASGREVPLLIEPCALTGAWVDPRAGLLSMIALELGTSTRLCAALKPGERVVVMGPTGSPTELPEGETVVLCGGGLGNAVLFSIGKAARERGSRVIYFAGYKKAADFYKREEIEAGADVVVWSVDGPPAIPARRPQDLSFVGNIVQAMAAYAEGALGPVALPLAAATRVIAIGSDRMMAAVAAARRTVLAPYLSPGHVGIGSINSPMQCMMKEVCAQCLQRHVDPVSGKERYVFSCYNQDQPLDEMDWGHLAARLSQNALEEKLGNLVLDSLLARSDPRRV